MHKLTRPGFHQCSSVGHKDGQRHKQRIKENSKNKKLNKRTACVKNGVENEGMNGLIHTLVCALAMQTTQNPTDDESDDKVPFCCVVVMFHLSYIAAVTMSSYQSPRLIMFSEVQAIFVSQAH